MDMGVGFEGEETETHSLTGDDVLMNTEYRRLISKVSFASK